MLHYACCSFAQLRRKYETLGAFPNSCVAGTVHHEPDTFHCKCRDAFLTGGPPALAASADAASCVCGARWPPLARGLALRRSCHVHVACVWAVASHGVPRCRAGGGVLGCAIP